jgi:hypothetical protein
MLSDERIRQIAAETVATEDWYDFPADAAAQSIRAALAEAAQVPKQDLSVCQYTAPKRIHLCVSDDEADHNRAFCDGFEPHDVTWAEDAPIAVCVEYVRADLAAAQVPVMGEAGCNAEARSVDKLQAELDALHKNLRLAMREASGLAMAMWRDFFKDASQNFSLCDSPAGVLSQIDNMYAGLRERIQLQNARISELEFVIEEIIRINHYDFRGHEIARAAMQERQP